MIYVFTLTATIASINLLALIFAAFDVNVVLPRYKKIDPREWFFLYPSIFYQIYFWVEYSGLFLNS